jgi:hypothetical protein
MADYEIRQFTPNGDFLRTLPFRRLEYALVENDVNSLALTLHPNIGLENFTRDTQLEVWRSVNGITYLEGSGIDGALWFVKGERHEYANDTESITLTAYDAKQLLRQRFVAGAAGSATNTKNTYADDMMRQIAREALGASAGAAAGRNLSAWLSVEADDGAAPILSKAFSHRNVLNVLQDIAEQSAQAGMYLSFDVIHTGRTASTSAILRFVVRLRQRGINRGLTSASRLVFSRRFGTLADTVVENDWREEVNAVTVGGAGEKEVRKFATAEDAARIGQTPFGRSEDFVDQTNIDTQSILQGDADARLWSGRPRLRVSGRLVESSTVRYGVHFRHGDIVVVDVGAVQQSARLSAVRVVVDENGESVDARVSTETVI